MERENPEELNLTPQRVFMLLYQWKLSDAWFLRTRICNRNKRKERQKWTRLKNLLVLPSMGYPSQKSLKQQPNYPATQIIQRTPENPPLKYSYPYPLTPSSTILITSTGRSASCPTKRNRQPWRILCGSGGGALWEAVHVFCENIMFLDTCGRSIMKSDLGKRCMCFVKTKCSLTLGIVTRSWSKCSSNYT